MPSLLSCCCSRRRGALCALRGLGLSPTSAAHVAIHVHCLRVGFRLKNGRFALRAFPAILTGFHHSEGKLSTHFLKTRHKRFCEAVFSCFPLLIVHQARRTPADRQTISGDQAQRNRHGCQAFTLEDVRTVRRLSGGSCSPSPYRITSTSKASAYTRIRSEGRRLGMVRHGTGQRMHSTSTSAAGRPDHARHSL